VRSLAVTPDADDLDYVSSYMSPSICLTTSSVSSHVDSKTDTICNEPTMKPTSLSSYYIKKTNSKVRKVIKTQRQENIRTFALIKKAIKTGKLLLEEVTHSNFTDYKAPQLTEKTSHHHPQDESSMQSHPWESFRQRLRARRPRARRLLRRWILQATPIWILKLGLAMTESLRVEKNPKDLPRLIECPRMLLTKLRSETLKVSFQRKHIPQR
jgi:hypothetical protein